MYPTYNFLTTGLAVDISTAPDLMAVDYRHKDHVHKDIHVSAHDFIA